MPTEEVPQIAPIKPLRRKQLLHQLAQEEIKSYIIEHSLKPGAPLPPETDLAQQLGIGRNSVREAVKALEALGILEARAGTGLFVRTFSFDSILDNLEYGLHFEIKRLADVLEVRGAECRDEIERVARPIGGVGRGVGPIDDEAAARDGGGSASGERVRRPPRGK